MDCMNLNPEQVIACDVNKDDPTQCPFFGECKDCDWVEYEDDTETDKGVYLIHNGNS